MRAVRNTAEGIAVVDVPEPDGNGVMITPTAVGICGSDLHILAMEVRDITIGHEIGAMVDGRPVAVQPFPFCGQCPSCLQGNSHLCASSNQLYGTRADGGMADLMMVDPRCLVEIPAGVEASVASLVEPIAVGIHAVNLAGLEPGMRVAVIGAGSVGLITGALARQSGVEVDISARHDVQRVAAERLGLSVGLGGKYDVVFDAAGSDASLNEAIGAVRPAGFPIERAAEAFAVAADRASGAIKVVIEPNG